MKLIQATERDDEDLKAFFNKQVLKGVFDYRLERTHSFFDQYKISTDDYQTYLLRDLSGEVQAMASMLFKKAYINDQEQTIGYVTDLRVSKSRAATLTWTKEFVPAFENEREKRNCQFIFSELEQFENIAYNTLLRRRTRNTYMPRYHLFRKFYLVAIYGKHFFAEKPLTSIKIEQGRTEDIQPLSNYLQSKSVRRPLRYNMNMEEIERRLRTWPNFSIQNFLVARNSRGDIIGCMAPWNNRDVQQVIAHKYKRQSFQVFSTSQTLAPFGLARALPKPGNPFKLKYITHGAYDNPDIFYSLLNRAFYDCKNREILVYQNYYGDFTTRPPLSFMHIKIPYGFYSVLDHETKVPPFLHPNPFFPAPDFNLCAF